MSVIHYGPDDLANIVSVAAGNLTDTRAVAHYLMCAETYSRANTEAYNRSYPDDPAEPWTADAISRFLSPWANIREAVANAGLLHYNAISNDGTEAGDRDTLQAIIALQSAVLFAAGDRLDALRQRERLACP